MLTVYEKIEEQAKNADVQARKWLAAGREDQWLVWTVKAATYRHALLILTTFGDAPN